MLISIETYCTCGFSVGEGGLDPLYPPSLDLHGMFALTPKFYVNKDMLFGSVLFNSWWVILHAFLQSMVFKTTFQVS